MIENEIKEKLTVALSPNQLDLWDESADHIGHSGNTGGGHFVLRIVSEKFSNLKRVERHKLIYEALNGLIPKKIHAISVQALTPEENDNGL